MPRANSASAAPERARIEYFPIAEIKKWPANPKRHDLDALGASMDRFGFVMPLLRDDKTGKLVAGHGRLERLAKMKSDGSAPPKRVSIGKKGEWLVPVICGVSFRSAREAQAYLLADNRLPELGGYDPDGLQAVLRDLASAEGGLVGTGWGVDDIGAALEDAGEKEVVSFLATPKVDGIKGVQPNLRIPLVFYITSEKIEGLRNVFRHPTLKHELNSDLFEKMVAEYVERHS